MARDTPDLEAPFTPRFPALIAATLLAAWILALCLPMFSGQFLVGPMSDQTWAGVPFRWFGAGEWTRTGGVPLWNPFMFGGMPFVGAMHGDIFYPTAWLRLVLPTDIAMNLGFAGHYVLAGFFAYLFLRALKVSWTGAVTGGIAYQLCGLVGSYVRPGHDGKLFVSALMPLVLLSLVKAIRDRRPEGYGLLALVVGLGLISPQTQLMQYTLIFAGLFTLYLAFWDEARPEKRAQRWTAVGLALVAVALGFSAAMIQLWPFINYLPYSARYAGAQGWEYATAYAMPWTHVVDWLVSDFTGSAATYWGENIGKLHTEYLGAATLVLASVGVADRGRRRLLWFLGGAWLLFVLVALGAHTPFYRLWYTLVPGVKSARAPGMAFFIPSFIVAVVAGFGVDRIVRGEGKRILVGWLVGAGALFLLAAAGGLASRAELWAAGDQARRVARESANLIMLSGLKSAVFAAAVAALAWFALTSRVRRLPLALGLVALVGGDLFITARQFWQYSPRAAQLYVDDAVTARIRQTPYPYRVFDPLELYPEAFLMGKRIPRVLGYHGNEMHAYDELLGGKNHWGNLFRGGVQQVTLGDIATPSNPVLWELLALRFLVLPALPQPLPGWHQVAGPAQTPRGQAAFLYERDTAPPYARIVPAAAKLPVNRILPTLLDPRLDVSRVVLLSEDAQVPVPRLDSMPARSTSRGVVTAWEPGAMTVRIDPAPEGDSYVLVSENWYPDWRATVDGRPAAVLRGDYAFVTVPVPRGTREVRLTMDRTVYRRGVTATMASLGAILLWLVIPGVLRRRST
jgi:hypothetical protein